MSQFIAPRKVGKLGRKMGVSEAGSAFKLSDYLVDPLPVWKGNDDFTIGLPTDLGMGWNDNVGDCGPCGDYHLAMANAHTAKEASLPVPDDDSTVGLEIRAAYLAYNHGIDQGVDLGQWLTWRLTNPLAGLPPIGGFAQVAIDGDEYQSALHLFGGLYTGILVNSEMQEEFASHQPWTSTDTAWIGGHCVPHLRRNAKWGGCVTWGAVQLFSWENWRAVREEAYVIFDREIMNAPGGVFNGVAVAKLKEDIAKLHGTLAA